jgi:hypothetical protein
MSATTSTRIPTSIPAFVAYMDDTDNYQLVNVPPINYVRWTWTAAQSAQWTVYRTQCDKLWLLYSNKKGSRTTDIKDQFRTLIKQTHKFDHDNKLLALIAIKGSNSDWEMFHIKAGTDLQDITPTRTADPGQKKPVLTIRKITHLQHQLTVRNPDKPKSGAMPKGMKFCKVYRYVASSQTPPTSTDQYKFIGNAKRGLIISTFTDADAEKTAWYIACYETNAGKLGQPCDFVKAVIA